MRRPRTVSAIDAEPDNVLVGRAAEGDSRCFEELYRRHAPAAWRVAYAVAGNPDDAADAVSDAFTRVFQVLPEGRPLAIEAFRPYLLAATRNAALDGLRRQGRLTPTPTLDHLEKVNTSDQAADKVLDSVDSNLVAVAFRSLPERWRSVLWLTEVEGIPAREAAPMLGVSANGLAQLAVRARAGLRQRFLQAHLRAPVARACQFPVDKLGAYIAGGLSPRETAKVDQHLAGCADCRQQVEELEDLGSLLRRVVTPVPLALAAVSLSKWKLQMKSVSMVSRNPALNGARKPVAAAAVALFALGVIGATVLDRPDNGNDPPAAAGRGPGEGTGGDSPTVDQNLDVNSSAVQAGAVGTVPGFTRGEFASGRAPGSAGGSAGSDSGTNPGGGGNPNPPVPPGTDPPPGSPPPPEDTSVLGLQLVAPGLGTAASAEVGGDCTGLELLGLTTLGCPGPAAEGLLTIRTSGILGENEIGL
jgi:RNA polymerase sigma factor (sigma-70 family)